MHAEFPSDLAPTTVVAYIFADLALIIAVARLVGWLFVRAKQPRVAGEIFGGILLGPTVLGPELVARIFPAQSTTFLSAFGQIGLVLYMMLVGVELNRSLLRGRERQIAGVALAVVIAPIGLGFVAAFAMDGDVWRPPDVSTTSFALLLGAGLTVSAFPVMARVLQEKGQMETVLGAVGMGSAAVVTVLMFLTIAAASAAAAGSGILGTLGLKAGYSALLILGLVLVVRPVVARACAHWDPGEPIQPVIAVLLVGALATALAADRIGISALVGGFLFGLVVPEREGMDDAIVTRVQETVLVLLLPVFLAVSGINTDLRTLRPELVGGLVVFVVLMISSKWGAGFIAGRLTGLSSSQSHALGVLLNCRGLLILVVALIGLELGVITPATQAAFVVGAMITTLMTGPLVDHFLESGQAPVAGTEPIHGTARLADWRER